MADITITAANVLAVAGSPMSTGTAGATITAGQSVYKDTTDSNKIKLADADVEASAVVAGVALNGASDGQPITYVTGGNLDPGGTVTVGEVYVVSATAGGIAPVGDLLTGDFVSVIGVGTTASNIALDLIVSGIAKP